MSAKIPTPNYTQMPNIILDNIHLLSDAELRVILVTCRQTFGYHCEDKRLSISLFMKLTGMSNNGVIRAVKSLLERELLERHPDGDGFSYSLNVIKIGAPPTTVGHEQTEPEAVTVGHRGRDRRSQGAVTVGHTYKERDKEKNKERAQAPLFPENSKTQEREAEIPPSLKTSAFEKAWGDWLAERRARKKPVTRTAAERQLKALALWGPVRAVQSIEASIMSGWTGLFEPKSKAGQQVGPATIRPLSVPITKAGDGNY